MRLAKTQSLTRAALEENVELSAASRLLKGLEEELGVMLLDRESRPRRLRAEVMEFYPQLVAFIDESTRLMQVFSALKPPAEHEERPLRISIPANIPRRRVISFISEFSQRAPNWKVEITGTADHLDVLEGRIEAAYLPYIPSHVDLHIIPVARATTFLLASPAYLRRAGTPYSVAELGRHVLITRTGPFYPVVDRLYGPTSEFNIQTGIERPLPPAKWVLPTAKNAADRVLAEQRVGFSEMRRHQPVLRHFSGDTLSCVQAVLDGMGIATDLSIGLVEQYLLSGELSIVLPEWHRPLWHTSIVSKEELWIDPQVGEFMQLFAERERRESRIWKVIFSRYGIDAEAIEARDL